jgi:hypothetical protein
MPTAMPAAQTAKLDRQRRARTLLADDAELLMPHVDMRDVLHFVLSDRDRRDSMRVLLDAAD